MLTATSRAPLEFLLPGLPQPCDAGRHQLLVRPVTRAGSGGGVTQAFFSGWFGLAIGLLVARKSAPADLSTSRVTASRLVISLRAPSMVITTGLLSVSISSPVAFRAQATRVAVSGIL